MTHELRFFPLCVFLCVEAIIDSLLLAFLFACLFGKMMSKYLSSCICNVQYVYLFISLPSLGLAY